jgi:hypothetical protein
VIAAAVALRHGCAFARNRIRAASSAAFFPDILDRGFGLTHFKRKEWNHACE